MRRLLLTRPAGMIIVPTFVGATAAAVATGVANVPSTAPSGDVGDTLLAFCWANNASSTWAAPSGWSLGAGNGAIGCQTMYRTADGTASDSPTFTRATSLTSAAGVIVIRIAKGTFAAAAVQTNASGTTATTPTVAAQAHQSLYVQVITAITTSAVSYTPPGDGSGTAGNPIERADQSSTGTAVGYAVGDEVAAFGPTGTRTWTKTLSQASRSASFVLSPAA